MNDAEKCPDQMIEQKSAALETPQMPIQEPKRPWGLRSIGRRWRAVFLTFLVLCAAGIPAIWLLIEKSYVVSGAIRVDPIVRNILTGENIGMSNYLSFTNAQALMVTSPEVVSRVAENLSNKGLEFSDTPTDTLPAKVRRILRLKEIKPGPEEVLKDAILDELITAAPLSEGEHIIVSMTWPNANESIRIVDSFIRNYMALEGTSTSNREERQLAALEDELRLLAGKMESYQSQIGTMAQEFGTKKLLGRYDMNLERVGKLLGTLTEVEARRIYLQAQVKFREQPGEEPVSPEEWGSKRQKYVNRDAVVIAFANNVVALEQQLIEDRQKFTPSDPEIKQKEELLEALRKRLDEHKEKVSQTFNQAMEKQTASLSARKLNDLKKQLGQAQAHEDKIKALLEQDDAETIDLGQKNLAIQELQDQLALTKEMHDTIARRIQEVEMDMKRPARIYVDKNADIAQVLDKRAKYTVALVVGAMVLGMLLAILRDKAIAQRNIIAG